MTDALSNLQRSENMRRIAAKHTSPELAVRRLVFSMGYRYRLHVRKLPGKPDLVFSSRKAIIDVRGCFWHQHGGCIDSHIPKSREAYWRPKLIGNVERDRRNLELQGSLGFRVLIVWECETKDITALAEKLRGFLDETL